MNDEQNIISAIAASNGTSYLLTDATKSAVSVDMLKTDVNMVHISLDDYNDKLIGGEILSNELYVVSADYVETYGQQIKNVADPTDLSDAVNKEYVDSNFLPAGSYLTAVPDAYKTYAATLSSLSSDYSLTSHTHSGYVPTSRKINGTQLTGDVSVGTITGITMNGTSKGTSGNVDLGTVLTAHLSLTGYVPTSRTVAGQQLTANVTAATISSAIGLGNYSLTSHTHADYVPTSRKINGTQLTGDVSVGTITGITMNGASKGTTGNVDLGTVLTAHQSLTGYVQTSRKVAGQALTADVAPATISAAIGLGNYSLTSHTHSDYSLTSHTHSQYLTAVPSTYKTYADTKTQLGTDGFKTYAATLSSLSSTYSLTSHTHAGYVPTSRTVAGMQLTGNVTLKNLSFGTKNYNGSTALTVTAGDLGALTTHLPVSAAYVDLHIRLSANNVLVGNIDCSDFVKDGMLSAVELCSDLLIFIFNAESGKTAISVALSNFIDETNYYTKSDLTGTNGVLKGYSLTSHTHSQYLTAVPSTYKTYTDTKTQLVADGFKTYAATLSSLSSTYSLTSHTHSQYSLTSHNHDSAYKPKQTAVPSPTASGSTTSFIDTISQNENGVIAVTKKSVLSASTSQAGIVQLNNSLTSTSTTQAATANAVKTVNDKFADYSLTSHTHSDYVLTSRKVAGQALTADVTAATISSAINLSGYLPLKGGTIANPTGYTDLWLSDGKTNGYAKLGVEKGNHYIKLYCTTADSYIDADNYTYRFPNKNGTLARQEDLNYALSTATGVLSSGSYVYDVADRTVTTISINLSTTPVIVRLPDAGNGARDFILRIEISSETAPTFTFTNTAGLDFESEDDDWAIMEPGVNLVSFTETKR